MSLDPPAHHNQHIITLSRPHENRITPPLGTHAASTPPCLSLAAPDLQPRIPRPEDLGSTPEPGAVGR